VIKVPKPPDLIPAKQMAEVLADIHIADASLSFRELPTDSTGQYYADYYQAIFEKHEISREQYLSSLNYYLKKPELLEDIYEDVNEILSTKRGIDM
jgi:hypothetical protein